MMRIPPSLPISTLGTEGRSAVVLDEVFRQFRKRKKNPPKKTESLSLFFLFNVEVNKNQKSSKTNNLLKIVSEVKTLALAYTHITP